MTSMSVNLQSTTAVATGLEPPWGVTRCNEMTRKGDREQGEIGGVSWLAYQMSDGAVLDQGILSGPKAGTRTAEQPAGLAPEGVELTDAELVGYLSSSQGTEGEREMKWTIRAKGKCKECGGEWKEVRKNKKQIGFICPACKILPTRYLVDIYHKGRIRLFSDQTGQVIDSYQRAVNLLSHINYELTTGSFDASRYVRAELEQFYTITLLDRFWGEKKDSVAPSYRKDYKRMIEQAKEFFKAKDVRDIRKTHLKDYLKHISGLTSKSGKPYNPKTLKNILDVFRAFLNHCGDPEDGFNIPLQVPNLPEIELTRTSITVFTQEEQAEIFNHFREADRPFIMCLILQGIRPGEARALRCKDVDFQARSILVSCTFSDTTYRERRKGKGSQPVLIPIHPELLEYVTSRVRGNLPEAWLFPNPRTGNHYTQSVISDIWDKVREKTGIPPHVRLYDFTRHSFITNLTSRGVTSTQVAKLVGHSSPKMVDEFYSHVQLQPLRKELKKISLKKKATVTKLETKALVGHQKKSALK
jgi:integrase